MAREAFGDGMLPQLQSAVYKVLKTRLCFIWNFCFVIWMSKKKKHPCLVFLLLLLSLHKLETKFRDNTNKTMTEREEPFRCFVKFASTNLLESFRHCTSAGSKNMFVTDSKEHVLKYFSKLFWKWKLWAIPKVTTKWQYNLEDRVWNWSNYVNHYITLSFYSVNQHFNPVVLKITLLLLLLYITGISSTPVTPLLSSILLKGRNNFVITDNSPAPSSQTNQQNWSWQTLQWNSSLWPLLTSSPHLMYFWHFYRHSPWFSSHGFWCVPTTN